MTTSSYHLSAAESSPDPPALPCPACERRLRYLGRRGRYTQWECRWPDCPAGKLARLEPGPAGEEVRHG